MMLRGKEIALICPRMCGKSLPKKRMHPRLCWNRLMKPCLKRSTRRKQRKMPGGTKILVKTLLKNPKKALEIIHKSAVRKLEISMLAKIG